MHTTYKLNTNSKLLKSIHIYIYIGALVKVFFLN